MTRTLFVLALPGCVGHEPSVVDTGLAAVEEGEWLPGGDTTNTLLLGTNAFLRPAANLSDDHESSFYSGNSYFNQGWIEAPASTATRDGLGPLFNATSCSGCHFRDGRAAPPDDGQGPFVGLLLRISVMGDDGIPVPDPVYGGQLQDQANPGFVPEVLASIQVTEEPGTYPDGTSYSLGAPTYTIGDSAYGPLGDELLVSPRVAPHMIGLGLLEAIPDDRLAELEDPDDEDGDGISGRRQHVIDAETGSLATGRFGWKAEAPTVAHQSAGAFAGDLGITSRLFPNDDCTEAEVDCVSAPSGGDPELEDHLLDLVVSYSRTVAVPVRRNWEDDTVLRGKRVFGELGCGGCHTPDHVTGPFPPIPELADQHIWPYTDLLLHDLGEALSDERPIADAVGSEWKTPPLWGIGLFPDVNGHTRYLHDGRARNLEEAILWHGGEAEASRLKFEDLDSSDRAALITFLEDL